MGKIGCKTVAAVLTCVLLVGALPGGGRALSRTANVLEAQQMFVSMTPPPTAAQQPTPSPAQTPAASPAPAPSLGPPSSPAPSFVPSLSKEEIRRLAPTTGMTFEELVGDNGVYESPKGYPAPGTFRLVVDLYHQVVLAYTRDKSGAYTVPVRFMVCTTGAQKTPTPRGTFSSGTHKVRFGLFVNDGVYGQYWMQITRRIYFHSLLYTRKDAQTYTSSYSKLGQRGSHGCVRLLVPDARWVYYHIAPGTEVEIRKGSKDDLETAFIKKNLTRPKRPASRPKLRPGEVPYTDNWEIATYLQGYTGIVSG